MLTKQKRISFWIIAFLAPGLIYFLVWILLGGYPFGERNILIWDMNQQYVDFFLYLKNLLQGEADLAYSFSKSLGGTNLGLYSYYLSSPLNLLVVFFDDMKAFIFVITVLKFSLCGFTSFLYFSKHFPKLGEEKIFLLSQSYSLMAYTVLQMNNIMWIDGVITLPLILLGVDTFVKKKKGFYIALSVGGSILCNWYSAYMAILFSVFYFIVLLCMERAKEGIYALFKYTLRSAGWYLLGVGFSAILFVPTVMALMNGKGSELFASISFGFRDSLFGVVKGNVIGTLSDGHSTQLHLFCGSISFVLALSFYFNRRILRKKRIVYFLLSLMLVFSAIFIPTDCIWNGLRFVASYYCRFAFVIIMLILILAGSSMQKFKPEKTTDYLVMLGIPVVLMLIGFLINYSELAERRFALLLTVFFLLAETGIFVWQRISKRNVMKRIAGWGLVLVLSVEMCLNMFLCYKDMYTAYNKDYTQYSNEVRKRLAEIEEREGDGGFYRVETTEHRIDCSMSEALAYGYQSVSHYSSAVEQNTAAMMYRMGYIQSERMPFYRSPILPSDSLFGVKYVMSSIIIPGEEKISNKLFYNPYALPLGLGVDKKIKKVSLDGKTPFKYQSQLYSALLGEKTELYEPVEYECLGKTKWQIHGASQDVIYGFIAMSGERDVSLEINGEKRGDYTNWNAVKVFSLDFSDSDTSIVELTGKYADKTTFKPYFCRLDMDKFKEVIDRLRNSGWKPAKVLNGSIQGTYESDREGCLFLSIPYDKGWSVMVNGRPEKIYDVLNGLVAVPVKAGKNDIQMTYHVRGLKIGTIFTVFSIIVALLMVIANRKNANNKGST